MANGENEMAMRKVLDMTRLISVVLLLLHFYEIDYWAFPHWVFTDRLMANS